MIIEYWNKVRSFVKWLIPFFLAIFLLFGCGPAQTQESRADMPVHQEQAGQAETSALALDKEGSYTSKEDVALYIHIYGTLPGNFITKKEAEKCRLGEQGRQSLGCGARKEYRRKPFR